LLVAGCWWGSLRLGDLDRSVLVEHVGRTALARVEVTGPARASEFALRVPVQVVRFDELALRETSRLELPVGRVPAQGAVLEVVATVRFPRPADGGGFDEAAYLNRQGVQVVLRADGFTVVGRRGGLGGAADAVRAAIAGSLARGLDGERRAVVAGVVLGEDEGLDDELRERFRASGLYHLLSVG
jgi:predicted membrane metal-binding protein